MEMSCEVQHSSEDGQTGSGKAVGSAAAAHGKGASQESSADSRQKTRKKGGDGSEHSVDSQELATKLTQVKALQDGGLGDKIEYIQDGRPSHYESEDEDSQQVRLSQEHGAVAEDIRLISAAIDNFGEHKYEDLELDVQFRNEVLDLPPDRLKGIWTQWDETKSKRIDRVWEKNRTLLHNAAKTGDHQILRMLLNNEAGKFVDFADIDGFTPLILAVDACDKESILILLEHSKNRVDALCAAIEFYEHENDDHYKIERQQLIDWLISLPKISGKKRTGKEPMLSSCYNNVSQQLPLSGLKLNAFQCLIHYKDLVYFDKLIVLLPEKISKISDQAGNTFLHLAVHGADPENRTHLELIKKIIDLQKPEPKQIPWVAELNRDNKTVLDIACEESALAIVDLLAANGAKLIPDQERSNNKSNYVSSLHRAIMNSDLSLVIYLFEKFPNEVGAIFQPKNSEAILQGNNAEEGKKKDILEELFTLALNAWRNKVLNKQDNSVQIAILKKLLERDTEGRIFLRLFNETEKKIHSNIQDQGIQKSLSDLCSKVHSDYCLVGRQNTTQAIELKLKALCLVSSIENVADSYSKQQQPSAVQKEEAATNFALCLRYLLYSNTWKTWAGIAVCALLGMIVGAVVGFIVGQLLSGGAGGGFVLGPPAAEYGWAVGTIIGCVVFGVGLASARYLFSDLFKSHMSHWAISKAMRNNINSHDDQLVKKANPSPRSQSSSEGRGHSEFGGGDNDFSFDKEDAGLLNSQVL